MFLFSAAREHRVTFAKRDRREAVRVHLPVVVETEPGLFRLAVRDEEINRGGDVFFIFPFDRRMSGREEREDRHRGRGVRRVFRSGRGARTSRGERPRTVGVLVFRDPSERKRDRFFASFGAAAGREGRRFVRAASGEFVAGQGTEERIDVGRETFGRQGIVGEGKGRARRVVVVGNFGDFGNIFRFDKIFRRRFKLDFFVFGVFDRVVEHFVEDEFVAHSGLGNELHRVRQVDFNNEQTEEEEKEHG